MEKFISSKFKNKIRNIKVTDFLLTVTTLHEWINILFFVIRDNILIKSLLCLLIICRKQSQKKHGSGI